MLAERRHLIGAFAVAASAWCATAEAERAKIHVVTLYPISSGFITVKQAQLTESIRRVADSAAGASDVSKLPATPALGIVGDYTVVKDSYKFSVRLITVEQRQILSEIQFAIAKDDVLDAATWKRELAPLFATPNTPGAVLPPPPTTSTTPLTPDPEDAGAGAGSGSGSGGVPELPPITTGGASSTTTAVTPPAEAGGAGMSWHGHLQLYAAAGVRHGAKGELITSDQRLQLEIESNVESVRVTAKPQLTYDQRTERFEVGFRELYAERDWSAFELAIGDQIATWGVTDFWPVVDIVNARDLSQFRNWRPIDEKLAAPMLRMTAYAKPFTLHLLALPYLRASRFQLDAEQPYALPVPAPPGGTVELAEAKPKLESAGGGVRLDVAVARWKLSLYGLVGRDVQPAVRTQIDALGGAHFVVGNERVGLGAVSLQGSAGKILVRAEAAAYRRLVDLCDDPMPGVVGCFYVRHTPTARATVSLERRILPGMDAHVQAIAEVTRSKDIPRLPVEFAVLAPGLPEQYPLNRIVTVRLQGDYRSSDFRPMVFAYASLDDEAGFVNADLEYHLGAGFAVAPGVLWFKSFASDPNKPQYTFAGSLEKWSNVYVRATGWF